jgi:hypothetical protein
MSLVTLGFIQAAPDGTPAWAGLAALAPTSSNDQAVAINQSIRALQAAGGDVMVSFGGAAGTSLAQWYAARGRTAADLAKAYAGIVDTYALNRIDFDIEGAAVADAAAIKLGSDALKLLQASRPGLEVWYTLPVLPTGLTAVVGTGRAVSLDWNDNTEPDFSEYGIYRLTSPVTASALKIAEVRASRFVDTDVDIGTTYYYWLNAYDTVENVSGFATSVSATPVVITAGPIDSTAPSTPNTATPPTAMPP